ncbi:hypothetical protein [Solibaculum mannosilyticum]|uniref:Uncharacterized protein n=1 Tax=Solibaculum mannosilyticum TaxID=2780922 RepID=A0A7I8D7U4_9FIRM|nr:hypothetical protein [Solibaculum mannosilyticum]MCO7137068.1 hypothetical protein [[Clostridium] leptum]BCI60704.1 hypothetical protein C12CBH8_13430 [Solibaculum mannosilyticum]CZT57668.1 hypothetical protein BN3661_02123 [Eubacteriaceae bacterium CHKCI005]
MWDKKVTFREALEKIIPAIANSIEEKLPETGKFKKFGYTFDVDAEYIEEGGLYFDYNRLGVPNGRIVILVGIFPDGSGYEMQTYLFWGNKQEILQYLRAPERIPEIMKAIQEIDERIRQHD